MFSRRLRLRVRRAVSLITVTVSADQLRLNPEFAEREALVGMERDDRATAEDQLLPKATALVNSRYKTRAAIATVEPIYDDAEQEVKGYMAFTKP